MDAAIFTMLKELVDPIIEEVGEDDALFNDPLLDLFNKETITGIQVPQNAQIDIYQFQSRPAVIIADRYVYEASDRQMAQGKIKLSKGTVQIRVTEDEMERIKQNGASGIITKAIRNEYKSQIAYLKETMRQYTMDPWQGVMTGEFYSSSIVGVLAASPGATLGNPADMNASAGSALDLNATVNLSGTARTLNNVMRIIGAVRVGMTKIDYLNKRQIPINQIYMGVHPLVMAILKSTKDLLNDTAKQESSQTLYNDFVAAGIQPIEWVGFDPDYTYATSNTSTICFFADPMENFTLYNINPAEGEGWTDWDKQPITVDGKMTISYETHKKFEFGVQATAYFINTSATASTYLKPVFWMIITPFENT